MDSPGSVRCESFRSTLLQLRSLRYSQHPWLAAEFLYLDHVPPRYRSAEVCLFYFSEFQTYRLLGSCFVSFFARRRALLKRSFRFNLLICEGNHFTLLQLCYTGWALVQVFHWKIVHPSASTVDSLPGFTQST
jgi:hypothetical protein